MPLGEIQRQPTLIRARSHANPPVCPMQAGSASTLESRPTTANQQNALDTGSSRPQHITITAAYFGLGPFLAVQSGTMVATLKRSTAEPKLAKMRSNEGRQLMSLFSLSPSSKPMDSGMPLLRRRVQGSEVVSCVLFIEADCLQNGKLSQNLSAQQCAAMMISAARSAMP